MEKGFDLFFGICLSTLITMRIFTWVAPAMAAYEGLTAAEFMAQPHIAFLWTLLMTAVSFCRGFCTAKLFVWWERYGHRRPQAEMAA